MSLRSDVHEVKEKVKRLTAIRTAGILTSVGPRGIHRKPISQDLPQNNSTNNQQARWA